MRSSGFQRERGEMEVIHIHQSSPYIPLNTSKEFVIYVEETLGLTIGLCIWAGRGISCILRLL